MSSENLRESGQIFCCRVDAARSYNISRFIRELIAEWRVIKCCKLRFIAMIERRSCIQHAERLGEILMNIGREIDAADSLN
ncbi:hypothetical protein D3C84_905440 [compost metagenome]